LIFSPAGFAPLCLAAILEEVASHGYVVVGVNHTGESAISVLADGRVVPMDAAWMEPVLGPFSGPPEATMRGRAVVVEAKAADLRLVLDRLGALNAGTGPFADSPAASLLAGRLDLTRLGAFGHSLGGNAALELARLDPHCTAAVNLDGGVWSAVGRAGLDRPNLLILADHPEFRLPCADVVRMGIYPSIAWCEAERALNFGAWRTIHERGNPSYAIAIAGSGHISFLDVPFLPIQPGSMMAGGLAGVRIESRRAWRIICDALLAFFGRHTSGMQAGALAALLDGRSDAHPEVTAGPPLDLLADQA
jgi:pimeloyl-ACP methyl ester carboxylesterase